MSELKQLPDENEEDLPESGSIDDKIELQKEKKLKHTLDPEPIKPREIKGLFGFKGPSFQDDPSSPDFTPLRERSELDQARWWAEYFRRKEKHESIYNQVEFDPVIVKNDEVKGFYSKLNEKTLT